MIDLLVVKLKKTIREKKLILLDLGVILSLGLLSLTWFKGGNLISGGDFDWILDWGRFLKQTFSVWDSTISFGIYRPIGVFIPFALPGALLQAVGFSPSLIEKVYFYLWFAGSGLSMYFLTSVLSMKRPGRLASAIFYMLNPFSLIIIWRVSHGHIQMPYAFAPLFLGIFIWGFLQRKSFKYIVLANLLLLLVNGSSYSNPRHLAIQLFPVFFFFIATALFNKEKILILIKYTAKFFIVFLLFNIFGFYPWLSNLGGYVSGAHSSVLLSDAEELKLTSVSLPKAIRMLGYWSLYSGYKGGAYYPYWKFYTLAFANILSWLIPVAVFLGFFQEELRTKRNLFFILGVIFFCLWGIKGPLPPLGGIVTWFYQKIPYALTAARFSFLLYGLPVYLIFSVLFGFGFLTIYGYLFKKIKNLALVPLGILLFVLCGVLVYPFWNGEVIKPAGEVIPSERFNVPDYWREAGRFLDSQPDFFRVLPLPVSKTYNTALFWGEGYSGADPTRWLTKKPVITTNSGQSFALAEVIGTVIEKENDFSDAAKLLGLLSTKYLLLRNDTRWEMMRGHSWWFSHDEKNISYFLDKQEGLTLEKEIGQLKFYKIDEGLLLPEIYSASQFVYVDGEPKAAEDLAGFLRPDEKEAVIFSGQNEKGIKKDRNDFGQYFIWREPKLSDKDTSLAVYELSVPEEGEYEVYLRDDGLANYYQVAPLFFEIMVDNQPVFRSELEKVGHNLLKLKSLKLASGSHQLALAIPPVINLLANASFEEGVWPSVELISAAGSPKEAAFNLATDAREGKLSLGITSGRNPTVAYLAINSFRPGDKYQISFSSKHLEGKEPVFALWQNDSRVDAPIWNPRINQFGTADPLTNFSSVKLSSVGTWQDYNFVFEPQAGMKTAGIAFVNEPNSKNLFDNTRVERVFRNPLFLKLKSAKTVLAPPVIFYKETGRTRYQIEVKGAFEPYLLVLSTAFDPQWRATINGEHLLVNGYANGWWISKTGDYKIELYYQPQKIWEKLLLIFVAVIASLVIFVFILPGISNRKNP